MRPAMEIGTALTPCCSATTSGRAQTTTTSTAGRLRSKKRNADASEASLPMFVTPKSPKMPTLGRRISASPVIRCSQDHFADVERFGETVDGVALDGAKLPSLPGTSPA